MNSFFCKNHKIPYVIQVYVCYNHLQTKPNNPCIFREDLFNTVRSTFQEKAHQSLTVFFLLLQDEQEFRDKITPISVAMEYNLDYQPAVDQSKLLPILDASTPNNVTKQVGSGRPGVLIRTLSRMSIVAYEA